MLGQDCDTGGVPGQVWGARTRCGMEPEQRMPLGQTCLPLQVLMGSLLLLQGNIRSFSPWGILPSLTASHLHRQE